MSSKSRKRQKRAASPPPLLTDGVQKELDVASRFRSRGAVIEELAEKVAGGRPGDLDVRTDLFVIEVKSGSIANEFGRMRLVDIWAYFKRLRMLAEARGKQPYVVLGEGALPRPLQKVLEKLSIGYERF